MKLAFYLRLSLADGDLGIRMRAIVLKTRD